MPPKSFPFTQIPQRLQLGILKCLDIKESLSSLRVNKLLRKETLIIGPFKQKLHQIGFSYPHFIEKHPEFEATFFVLQLTIDNFTFFIRSNHLTIQDHGRTEKTIFTRKPFSLFASTIKPCETLRIDLCPDLGKDNINRLVRNDLGDQRFLPDLQYVANFELTLVDFPAGAGWSLLKNLHLVVTDACILDTLCAGDDDFDEQYKFWCELIETTIDASNCQVIASNTGFRGMASMLNAKANARLFIGVDLLGHYFSLDVDQFFEEASGLDEDKAILLHLVEGNSIDSPSVHELLEYFLSNKDAHELDQNDPELDVLDEYFEKQYGQIDCWDFIEKYLTIDPRLPKDYFRNFNRKFREVAYMKETRDDDTVTLYMLTIEKLVEKPHIVQLFAYRECST